MPFGTIVDCRHIVWCGESRGLALVPCGADEEEIPIERLRCAREVPLWKEAKAAELREALLEAEGWV